MESKIYKDRKARYRVILL